VIFGVGRGYHTREVETLGGPMIDAEANRSLFEEQVEILFRAFREESFSHRGAHYTIPPAVPYRGYELSEITLVPRPVHPVECWQPIVSASRRGLDFMAKYGIKGIIGGGAATMAEGPITGYRDALGRTGRDLPLGSDLCVGIFVHLADSRERAVRELTPFYEEHVKMFGPLGFVPGITEDQLRASTKRGGWDAAGVPKLEHFMKTGAWYAGPPEGLVAYLTNLESRYPGLEYVNVSSSMGTPEKVCLEQLAWFAKEVMPKFPAAKA
jgi:alkanesulfonate monooxygenase SsuD/methylene tetrahydromethanopterin reductase-like flavin-dependent oxidoreductase (luciferase family)